MYQLRDYQKKASDAAVMAFEKKVNGLIVLPTGSGKSLVLADIASRIDEPLIILQPSKEILEQNYAKLKSYGYDAAIYSASMNSKDIKRITFATIGSIVGKDGFHKFKYVLIDECHLVNPRGGQYKQFIKDGKRTVVGLTATPYRLHSNAFGSELRFLTRTRPSIFKEVLYACQVSELMSRGYLAKLRCFDLSCIDQSRLKENTTGADFTDQSVKDEYKRISFSDKLYETTMRVMNPKNGIPRKGILVFTRFIEEAQELCDKIPGSAIVTGTTPKKERERILSQFKKGIIPLVANVGVLTTGFDYPELDTVIMARPTMSLSLYYQIFGRAIRPFEGKDGWFIDLCGNLKRFGKVDDLWLEDQGFGKWVVTSNGKQLTNVISKNFFTKK